MQTRAILLTVASIVLLGLGTQSAFASGIEYDTRFYSGTPAYGGSTTSAQYVAGWNALEASPPTTNYGDTTVTAWSNLSNNTEFGTNQNIAYHVQASFVVTPADAGTWTFHLGADYGHGGTVLMDGAPLATNTGNFYDANNAFVVSANLSAGIHTLTTVGFEDCCDGPTNGTFNDPLHTDGQFLTIGNANLTLVPEPASIVLGVLGGIGLMMTVGRRRKN